MAIKRLDIETVKKNNSPKWPLGGNAISGDIPNLTYDNYVKSEGRGTLKWQVEVNGEVVDEIDFPEAAIYKVTKDTNFIAKWTEDVIVSQEIIGLKIENGPYEVSSDTVSQKYKLWVFTTSEERNNNISARVDYEIENGYLRQHVKDLSDSTTLPYNVTATYNEAGKYYEGVVNFSANTTYAIRELNVRLSWREYKGGRWFTSIAEFDTIRSEGTLVIKQATLYKEDADLFDVAGIKKIEIQTTTVEINHEQQEVDLWIKLLNDTDDSINIGPLSNLKLYAQNNGSSWLNLFTLKSYEFNEDESRYDAKTVVIENTEGEDRTYNIRLEWTGKILHTDYVHSLGTYTIEQSKEVIEIPETPDVPDNLEDGIGEMTTGGEVCMYDTKNNRYISTPGTVAALTAYYNANQADENRFVPVGIILVPHTHGRYGDYQTAGVMSLTCMNSDTPETGSTNFSVYDSNNDKIRYGVKDKTFGSPFKLNAVVPNYGYYFNNEEEQDNICGVNTVGRLATDHVLNDWYSLYVESKKRKGLYYCKFTAGNAVDEMYYAPTPYNTDGTANSDYTDTVYNSNNLLAMFNGKELTDALIALRVGTESFIRADYFPAASICRKFKTESTNSGDWYLPSAGELGYLIANIGKYNDSIKNINSIFNKTDSKVTVVCKKFPEDTELGGSSGVQGHWVSNVLLRDGENRAGTVNIYNGNVGGNYLMSEKNNVRALIQLKIYNGNTR